MAKEQEKEFNSAKAHAEADRKRELARRQARAEAQASQKSIIVHGTASK